MRQIRQTTTLRKLQVTVLILCLAAIIAATAGCGKKTPPPPPPEPPPVEEPAPPPPTPTIGSFTHDAQGEKLPGDTINFALSGVIPDGGSVVVEIPGTSASTRLSGSDGNYTGSLTIPELDAGEYTLRAKILDADGNEVASKNANAKLRVGTRVTACQVIQEALGDGRVHFAFDRDDLDDAATAALSSIAGAVRGVDASGLSFVVEGHCDERGTIEYNLGLGQRRGDRVRAFLTDRAGLSGSDVRVVSFGEERPLDPASNDDAWAKNRRAEIRVEGNGCD